MRKHLRNRFRLRLLISVLLTAVIAWLAFAYHREIYCQVIAKYTHQQLNSVQRRGRGVNFAMLKRFQGQGKDRYAEEV